MSDTSERSWGDERRDSSRRAPVPALSSTAQDPLLMRIIAYYGPTAFGLVCFLAVWYAAVRPTLENNRVDSKAMQAVADTMRETSNTMNSTANTLMHIVQRLELIERRSPPSP
jgi:hypothetical protein